MTAGQVVLLVLVAALGLYALVLRTRLIDRIVMLALALAGVILVAWPGLASDVAQGLGIGRGTDLVFYLFIIFCLFRFVSASAEARRLERQLTEVVRELALRDERALDSSRPSEPAETGATARTTCHCRPAVERRSETV